MRFLCALHALYLRFTCALTALSLLFNCAFSALCMRFTCALPAPDLRFFVLFSRDDVIFQSGNILINRGDIDDILTNQYFFDNHLYKGYKHDYQMFIQHITPDSVRESKLIIKQIHEDKAGVFPSDITTWKLQTVRGIPTQSNEYDCGIFVCKYMERVILKKKTDWASLKEWQKYMPKFRAELGYALCLTTKM
ncbi:hypothetical protein IEQ34_006253 [Dendrobium chrysotoxum]|uniref:Ubiquitin-like protease family profile domain-containing protein n=1 Tax=Dendrobium chrysotoxum TaxID=161865 RepID=A0AAV7HDC9_DENCH|nr:hypothetical protein IEQ34_006253 [Dendrobium chrysotoxum]